jgi:hypothetical protein
MSKLRVLTPDTRKMIEQGRREILPTPEAPRETDCADPARADTDAPIAVSVAADLIAEIKATFGVSITDLAAIVGVSRQIIYDWIGDGQVSEANYGSLLALRQVCLDWQARVKRPVGRLLHARNAHGQSLLDLLGQKPLDRSAIGLQLDSLAAKALEQAGQLRERNARLAPLSEGDRYENALMHVFVVADSRSP